MVARWQVAEHRRARRDLAAAIRRRSEAASSRLRRGELRTERRSDLSERSLDRVRVERVRQTADSCPNIPSRAGQLDGLDRRRHTTDVGARWERALLPRW